MITKQLLVVSLVITSASNTVFAQLHGPISSPPPTDYQPIASLPSSAGESYHHDSTAAGNFMRGRAAVVHAQGNYQLNLSQAAMLAGYARSLALYNHQLWISYCAANQERRITALHERLAATRKANESQWPAKYEAAYHLSETELHRKTGTIIWPEALKSAQFDEWRSPIDRQFRDKAAYGSVDRGQIRELTRCIETFRRAVTTHIREIPRDQYVAAQRFLVGLKYESVFSTGDFNRVSAISKKSPGHSVN